MAIEEEQIMTTTEYAHFVLQAKLEAAESPQVDEAVAVEAAHLISGDFTYP